MKHGPRVTFELDTCTVVFGYDMFRPENVLFVSKWSGEAAIVTTDEFIEAMRQAEEWKKQHPELEPMERKPRGRPRGRAALAAQEGKEQP